MNQMNEKRNAYVIIAYLIARYLPGLFIAGLIIAYMTEFNPFSFISLTAILVCIVAAIPLGIASLVWQSHITRDLNYMCASYEGNANENRSFAAYFFLSMITAGFYGWYWMYKQGARVKMAANGFGGQVDQDGGTYVLWSIIGSMIGLGNIIAWILLNKNTNALAKAYNHRHSRAKAPGTFNASTKEQAKPRYNDQTGKLLDDAKDEAMPKTQEIPDASKGKEMEDDDDETVFYSHKILFSEGQYKGGFIELDNKQTLTLGRDGEVANVIFDDSAISKKHCTITWDQEQGCFIVCDLSSNGTFYENGERFPKGEPVKCKVNTVIKLADGSNVITLL